MLKYLLNPALLLSLALFSSLPVPLPGSPAELLLGTAHAEQRDSQSISPTQHDLEKARVVTRLLQTYHYGNRDSDEDLHVDAANAYLRLLDPGRFFLLAKDVEQFRESIAATSADDADSRLKAAFDLHATYRQRVKERVDYALSLLDSPPEFDSEQRFKQDRSDAEWATDNDELDKLWRKRVAHDHITLDLAERHASQPRDNLERRYRNILERVEEAEHTDITEKYLDAWAHAFDPHSSYFSPRRSEEFDMEMSLELEGIGAKLTMKQDMTEIVELIPGGPAERSGKLEAGERIIGVADGKDGEIKDIVGRQLHDVVQMIRGPKESTVRLKVLPPPGAGETSPRVVSLVRNKVALEGQAARKKVIEKPSEDGPKHIGVIEIPRFYRDFNAAQAGKGDFRSTTRDVRNLLSELQEEGIDGLIIDLRGNSGGALQEAIGVTSLFTGGGPVVQVRHHDGSIDRLGEPEKEPAYTGPLAIMVDRRSASASEILAGAIQDYERGVILGSKTFGKGTVQHMIDLNAHGLASGDGEGAGRLKLTIAQFYRVSGKGTQLQGITPDITLPSTLDHDEYGERAYENPLPARSIAPLDVAKHFELDSIIDELRARHKQRIKEDKAFQAYKEELEYRSKLREQISIALTREVRNKEQERREQRLLELRNERRAAHDMEPVESYDKMDAEELPDLLQHISAELVRDQSILLDKQEGPRGVEFTPG